MIVGQASAGVKRPRKGWTADPAEAYGNHEEGCDYGSGQGHGARPGPRAAPDGPTQGAARAEPPSHRCPPDRHDLAAGLRTRSARLVRSVAHHGGARLEGRAVIAFRIG